MEPGPGLFFGEHTANRGGLGIVREFLDNLVGVGAVGQVEGADGPGVRAVQPGYHFGIRVVSEREFLARIGAMFVFQTFQDGEIGLVGQVAGSTGCADVVAQVGRGQVGGAAVAAGRAAGNAGGVRVGTARQTAAIAVATVPASAGRVAAGRRRVAIGSTGQTPGQAGVAGSGYAAIRATSGATGSAARGIPSRAGRVRVGAAGQAAVGGVAGLVAGSGPTRLAASGAAISI